MTAPTRMFTAAQRGLIDKLLAEKVINDVAGEGLRDMLLVMQTTKQASAIITLLMGFPDIDPETGTTRKDPEPGLYGVDGEVYRVTISKSGNWYAQKAVKPAPGSGRVNLTWDYLGKRVNLTNAQPLTDEAAGMVLVFCVRCGAPLTDPESVARGIGPICKDKV